LNPHTQLINYTIALCKGHKDTFSPLNELGYDVQLIEQKISTQEGEDVKPDLVKVSKKLQHAIIFECKSGSNDEQQMKRYEGLTDEDLRRWVTIIHHAQPLKFDVCIVNFDTNHGNFMMVTKFPILTYGDETISKSNKFSLRELDDVFSTPIKLDRMRIPLNYYPFSDLDTDPIIIERLLRQLVSMVIKRARGGAGVLDATEFPTEDLFVPLHPYWNALSQEHRNRLSRRIRSLLRRLLDTYPMLREQLEEARTGNIRIRGPPSRFTSLCEQIITESKIQRTLDFNPQP
jgi:hypothetical protein